MRVNPFSGYLDAFPRYYKEDLISKQEIENAGFPVHPYLLPNACGFEPKPINHNGKELYNIKELIGFTRMCSIPNEGHIERKIIRAAEILDIEITKDKETGTEEINNIYVACAFMPSQDRRRGTGQVVFICPFCGCIHFHGAGGEKFGDGNGNRVPHCTCTNSEYYRLDARKFNYQLSEYWHFDLVETEDIARAGAFPKYFEKYLMERRKG